MKLCTVLLPLSLAMWFHLSPGQKKCIKEEIHKDVVVTGEFEAKESPNHRVDLKVTDSKDHILYQKEAADSGKFAFTTDVRDLFEVCFTSKRLGGFSHNPKAHEVKLVIRKGVEAKSYDEQAKTEKLKPLEVELRRLEDLSDSIVNDFQAGIWILQQKFDKFKF